MQIWACRRRFAYLSNLITLQPGDLIISKPPRASPVKAAIGSRATGRRGRPVVTYKA